VGDLTYAQATYESARGTIASRWERAGKRIILKVTIPPGVSATVELPRTTLSLRTVQAGEHEFDAELTD
jgi:alpha-L-rhamnosidase